MEGIDIAVGDAAAQVGGEVLNVLGLGAVDVAREVEVVVVFRVGDFGDGHHAGVAGDFLLAVEGVHNAVDVLLAEAVLGAVLAEAFAGIHHEDAFAGLGVFLVDDDDAGWDADTVEEVGGQADDAFDDATLDEVFADDGLGVSAEQHAVGKDAGSLAGALERADDVEEIGVAALLVGWHAVAGETLEGVVLGIKAGGPAFVGERRVGGGVVEGLEGVAVEKEWISEGVSLFDFRRGAVVQDHVHPGEAGGGGVLFLSVERDAHAFAVQCDVGKLQQQ